MPSLPPVPNTPLRDDPTQDSIWKRWLQLLKQSYSALGTVTSVTVSGGTTGLTGGGPITTSGTITLGGILVGANGGTGVANTGKTITLGGNLTTTPANAITFTTTGATNVTLPTSGTLGVGTVTSVAQSFTGGLISVAGSPVTSSGTLALTVAGTSGGVPYFSGATTWATSAALAASAIVLGGGAGNPPATTTTGTGVVTALGVNVGTAGSFVVNGGALGSPSTAGTIPAFTLGGTIAGGGNQLNNIIIGTSTPLAGTFTIAYAASGFFASSSNANGFSFNDGTNSFSLRTNTTDNRLAVDGSGNFVASGKTTLATGLTTSLLAGTSTDGAGSGVSFGMTLDANANRGVMLASNVGAAAEIVNVWHKATTGDNVFQVFTTEGSAGTGRGSITYNRGAGLVAYNTTSDERAKTVRGVFQNPGALIDAVPVYDGRMVGATFNMPTMKAHELQAVAPFAVTGQRNAMDLEGKPIYQQVSHGALVPLMWAEIQSLRFRIATLEAR